MICEVCQTDFHAKRRDARFCSPKCRLLAYAKREIQEIDTLNNPSFGEALHSLVEDKNA